MTPMNRISALMKETPHFALWLLLQCEDTAKRQPSTNLEAGPHQTPDLPAPRSWTSQPPEP